MANNRTKGQTTIHKTLHRKLKIKQHENDPQNTTQTLQISIEQRESHQKQGANSGVPEG